MGRERLIPREAVDLVSDHPPPLLAEDATEVELGQTASAEVPEVSTNGGPDTSSFAAFLASFLSGKDSKNESESESDSVANDSLSRDKNQELKNNEKKHDEAMAGFQLPEISERSMLLTEKTRRFVYDSLPALCKGRKWVLLYSTWRHGISLSTLYRRSNVCSGFSLLVVGDCKGAVFGGLVEAPLKPSKTRKYQGTNSTFLFTDMPGKSQVYRSTGANKYYTLCSPEFVALGGGDHFALYLDNDLLNGSSRASETYGNSCLANSQDFAIKGVELWGFVNASKYEETIAACRAEAPPGICRW